MQIYMHALNFTLFSNNSRSFSVPSSRISFAAIMPAAPDALDAYSLARTDVFLRSSEMPLRISYKQITKTISISSHTYTSHTVSSVIIHIYDDSIYIYSSPEDGAGPAYIEI